MRTQARGSLLEIPSQCQTSFIPPASPINSRTGPRRSSIPFLTASTLTLSLAQQSTTGRITITRRAEHRGREEKRKRKTRDRTATPRAEVDRFFFFSFFFLLESSASPFHSLPFLSLSACTEKNSVYCIISLLLVPITITLPK